ncbi:hypothetical protein GCM10020229_55840 [Kitasatospora albolonga]
MPEVGGEIKSSKAAWREQAWWREDSHPCFGDGKNCLSPVRRRGAAAVGRGWTREATALLCWTACGFWAATDARRRETGIEVGVPDTLRAARVHRPATTQQGLARDRAWWSTGSLGRGPRLYQVNTQGGQTPPPTWRQGG